MNVETLIHAGWVIPVEPEGVLVRHSIAVDAGRIVAILPTDSARAEYRTENEVDLPGHALIPGLINAHTHAAMSLMRGLADDLPLMEWLKGHIWPAEARWVSPEFVRDGSQLAMAEMLRSGTTCFNDMYFFPDEVAKQAKHAGVRAVVGLIVIDFPTAWAESADEYLHKALEVHDSLRNDTLVTTAFAPHAPYTVSDGPLERVATYAEELDIPIHIHLHETADEISDSVQQFGMRPIERLERLGLISPRLLAVHMTQLTQDEIEQIAAGGAHVANCPESNLKLANGFCPTAKLLDAGVNTALGTDGAASNNDLDMFSEMRTGALLAKGVAGDASVVPAAAALRMATLSGARALGLDGVTGSLEPGKAADIVAVRLDDIETSPVYHPLSQLVYAAGRDQVTDVWVAGRRVLREGELTTIDIEALRARTAEWRKKLGEFD
ncbi:TRZ/ATZ family hydrolase [Thiohalomonas denitrificans]|uniref:TRZ/ATZ family hydrolase n=1 Tax=Thiohalomonas denitrificans TaxID=415747 RepID=UPI0026EE6375|nr:TRZ/ATZ family hydrolase [Thiohalomonas denitrificans]